MPEQNVSLSQGKGWKHVVYFLSNTIFIQKSLRILITFPKSDKLNLIPKLCQREQSCRHTEETSMK